MARRVQEAGCEELHLRGDRRKMGSEKRDSAFAAPVKSQRNESNEGAKGYPEIN